MTDLELHLTGSLHPHLLINAHPPAEDCELHLALEIPDALFPDPDELVDLWGKSNSSGAAADKPYAWAVFPRDIDIERPVLASAALVRVSLWTRNNEVDIPLHARYLPPSSEGWHNVTVFGEGGGSVRRGWACGSAQEKRAELELLDAPLSIRLPAAKPEYHLAVEVATAAVVWLGWAWLAYKIIQVVRSNKAVVSKGKTE